MTRHLSEFKELFTCLKLSTLKQRFERAQIVQTDGQERVYTSDTIPIAIYYQKVVNVILRMGSGSESTRRLEET